MEKSISRSSPRNENNTTQETRKKIDLIKKALLKEREEKQKEFEELEKIKKQLSILELTLSEKDNQIEIFNNEREFLEKDLQKLKEKSNKTLIGSLDQGSQQNIKKFEKGKKQLLEELQIVKQKNTELKARFATLSQQCYQTEKQISLKDENLKKVIYELQDILAENIRQQELSEKELMASKNIHHSLSDTEIKLKNEIIETELKQKQLENDITLLNKELQDKQAQVMKLNEKLLKQSEHEAALYNKLMIYKNELANLEYLYQKHEATRLNSLNNYFATIILKRDHTGQYIIEIEERNHKLMYGINNVSCVSMHPHTDQRFYIRFADGQVFEYESDEASSIVVKMNYFIDKARDT